MPPGCPAYVEKFRQADHWEEVECSFREWVRMKRVCFKQNDQVESAGYLKG